MRIFLTTILALTVGGSVFAQQKPGSRRQPQRQQRVQPQPVQQQRPQQQYYYYQPQQLRFAPQFSQSRQYYPQQPATQQQPGAQFTQRQQLYYRYRLANGQVRVVPLQNRPASQQQTQGQSVKWYMEPTTGLYFSVPTQHRFVAKAAFQNVPTQVGQQPNPGMQAQSSLKKSSNGPSLGPVPQVDTAAVVQTKATSEEPATVAPASASSVAPPESDGPSLTPVPTSATTETPDTPPVLPVLQAP